MVLTGTRNHYKSKDVRSFKFEVCANSVRSAIAAQEGGADRVELCQGIPEGGTTPSFGDIKLSRKFLKNTKLHVIIRPRSGDFLYTDMEKEIMLEDIHNCLRMGTDGVVFGALLANGEIDMDFTKDLVKASGKMSKTFHRAFDVCKDPFKAMDQLASLGVDRILTSGQEASAYEGIPLLKKLQQRNSGKIILLAGCGIREHNIAEIAQKTGICEFHFSARETIQSQMIYRNEHVSMGGSVRIDEFSNELTTREKVKKTIEALISL